MPTDTRRAERRADYLERKISGRCTAYSCPHEQSAGTVTCERHALQFRLRSAARESRIRTERLAAGLCASCGKAALVTTYHCQPCRARVTEVSRVKRKATQAMVRRLREKMRVTWPS